MNFIDLAIKRCSVRGYLDTPVEEEKINYVLEAARAAPSACNNQPWVFIVIKDPQSRRRLEKVYNRQWFFEAPVIIAACCDGSVSWKRKDGKDYGDIDVAIALDHLTLAAAEKGLGTCWIGAFDEREARTVLLLPKTIHPVAFTPLGYPASEEKKQKMRKQLNEIVHWEFFGGKQNR